MSEPMSEARLAEMEARAQAATPGPWFVCNHAPEAAILAGADLDGDCDRPVAECASYWDIPGRPADEATQNPYYWEDALFIATAREDIPDLLAEVRRLRAAWALLAEHGDTAQDRAYARAILLAAATP